MLIVQGGQHLGETETDIATADNPDLGTRLVRFVSYLTIWFTR